MPRPLQAHVPSSTGGDSEAVRNHTMDAARRIVMGRARPGGSRSGAVGRIVIASEALLTTDRRTFPA